LERQNRAAMRVMAYPLRLLGLEIARDELPVFLVGHDLLDPPASTPDEKYASANPPMILPPEVKRLAVIGFSGRYDIHRTPIHNFQKPRNIYFTEIAALTRDKSLSTGPAKIIFRSGNREMLATIRSNYPAASLRDIPDIDGQPLLTVATLGKSGR
jgi:hypothetical protein